MGEIDSIKAYFNESRLHLLNIKGINEAAGLPPKTLDHFIAGRRSLNEEHIKKLLPVLERLGYVK